MSDTKTVDTCGPVAIAQVLAGDHSDRVASLVLGATWVRLDARLRKLFVFRKQALYEQVGFDRRGASCIRRRKSRRRASTRCSLVTPENACGISATRRCWLLLRMISSFRGN